MEQKHKNNSTKSLKELILRIKEMSNKFLEITWELNEQNSNKNSK